MSENENKKLAEVLKEICDSLTDEQKKKAKACKNEEELLKLAAQEGIELPDGALDMISGGIQAGLFTSGGSGEFGPSKPEVHKPPQPTWF